MKILYLFLAFLPLFTLISCGDIEKKLGVYSGINEYNENCSLKMSYSENKKYILITASRTSFNDKKHPSTNFTFDVETSRIEKLLEAVDDGESYNDGSLTAYGSQYSVTDQEHNQISIFVDDNNNPIEFHIMHFIKDYMIIRYRCNNLNLIKSFEEGDENERYEDL